MSIIDIVKNNKDLIKEYVKYFPDSVAEANYYAGITFEEIMEFNFDEFNEYKVGQWFQDFWEALPDNASIRFGAFYKICDIAEQYCFGEEE